MQRLFNSRESLTLDPNSRSNIGHSSNTTRKADSKRISSSKSSTIAAQLTSRTLALASASLGSSSSNDRLSVIPRPTHSISDPTRQHVFYRSRTLPVGKQSTSTSVTPQEMYWASRAIHSETLLAAATHHHHEMKELMRSRADEILSIKREHDSRKAKLEWILVLLAVTITLLSAYVLHLSIYPRHKSRGWINFIFPDHFAIPILSPFASVVETESSMFNSRILMLGLILTGALVYGLIRHRMNVTNEIPKSR